MVLGGAVIVSAGAVMVGGLLSWSAFSDRPMKIARPVAPPPNNVYPLSSTGYAARVEKAFFASWHDGFHGDGEDVTAYKIVSADTAGLIAALQREHPDFRWREERAEYSLIHHLAGLFPVDFRWSPDALLICGDSATDSYTRVYYVDWRQNVLFVVSVQY